MSIIIALIVFAIVFTILGKGKEVILYFFTNGIIALGMIVIVIVGVILLDYILTSDERKEEKESNSRVDSYEQCVGNHDQYLTGADLYLKKEECKQRYSVSDRDLYGDSDY